MAEWTRVSTKWNELVSASDRSPGTQYPAEALTTNTAPGWEEPKDITIS
jgi:hypothetical protein